MTHGKLRHSTRPSRPVAKATVWFALAGAGVFAAVLGVFWPAVFNEFVDWDDKANFVDNPHFRGLGPEHLKWMFTTFHMGHYQPLTWLTLGFDATWARLLLGNELDPRAYHLTNVVLHSLNAVCLFLLACRLLAWPSTDNRRIGPVIAGGLVAAMFFGIHPLRVESVAWATERRDLVSGLFLLLAALAYLKAARSKEMQGRWLAVSVLLFLLSLLGKVIGVTLPVVLLIVDWYPLGRLPSNPAMWVRPEHRKVLLEKAPYFALSAIFSLIATTGQAANQWLVTLEMHAPLARVVQAAYGLAFYAWKTVWPTNLLPIYEARFPLTLTEPRFIVGGIAVVVVSAMLGLARKRMPAAIAAALVYIVMLAPVLGLIQNGSQVVADRYSYLPCMGFAIAAGAVVRMALEHGNRLGKAALAAVSIAILALLMVLTRDQIKIWRNTTALWTHTATHDIGGSIVQNGYGYVLLQQGRLEESIVHLRKAIEFAPANVQAHHNLWNALRQMGDRAALRAALRQARQFRQIEPAATEALARLEYETGTELLQQKQHGQAAAAFEAAIALNPNHLEARTNLGFALISLNRAAEGLQQYRLVLEIDPRFFPARLNLGLQLRAAGKTDEAIEHLRVAVELRPDNAMARTALDSLLNPSTQP